MLPVLLFVVAAWLVLGAVLNITLIGKPRETLTGGIVAITVVIQAGIITVLILSALALS